MRILKIEYDDIPIFNNGFQLDLTGKDRVLDSESLAHVWNTTYTQSVVALTGINAVGKTTALKLLNLAFQVVVNNRGLNDLQLKIPLIVDEMIFSKGIKMRVTFYSNKNYYQLESIIKGRLTSSNELTRYFESEVLREKPRSSVKSKKDIFNFTQAKEKRRSDLSEEELRILKSEDSMVVIVTENKNKTVDFILNSLEERVIPVLNPVKENIDKRILKVLDSNLAELGYDGENVFIKFENKNTRIESDSSLILEDVLSLGTIKGQNIFKKSILALKSGGYLLIDELENSLNKEIVNVIINIFNDKNINKNGACLIFTTHYPEILDYLERKDNIYVLKRDINQKTTVTRYSEHVKRNELKKSDVILSNYIKGTAPSAIKINQLEDYICQEVSSV